MGTRVGLRARTNVEVESGSRSGSGSGEQIVKEVQGVGREMSVRGIVKRSKLLKACRISGA
jgi:hypothetical protein